MNIYLQAIRTRYISPNNVKGARMSARCRGGSVVIEYDHAVNLDRNHKLVCDVLRQRMNWTGPMTPGVYNGDTYWVFTTETVR